MRLRRIRSRCDSFSERVCVTQEWKYERVEDNGIVKM